MKFDVKDPPRQFEVGNAIRFNMKDCGTIALAPDEQVTFSTPTGGEYDVARKDWGFYATPSLNGRLPNFGLRGALIKNRLTERYFVLLVETGREESFDAYCQQESLDVILWLDDGEELDRLRDQLSATDA